MSSLYLLQRINDEVRFDEYDSFVVRATSEASAREFAALSCCDEGPDVWLDSDLSVALDLRELQKDGVVLGSFSAGPKPPVNPASRSDQ